MHNEFTAIIEKDNDWYIAYSPEISGANGQGRTLDEARQSLAESISLILEDLGARQRKLLLLWVIFAADQKFP
ncbi:MAG: type II toxin-antitoxin system HicB family antitoxin [Acidobacteria bacterium]|jgi:predicted RNase H-like HicB family nuclease|nr:type II toxin-antitoxin system HicB family antitoxin [Acidobacteriota bacterium]